MKMKYEIEVNHLKNRFRFIKGLEKFLRDEFEKGTVEGYRLRASGCTPIVAQGGKL